MRYRKALFLAALVLAGCEQGMDPAQPGVARQAAAVASHGSFKEPFSAVVINPCVPEEVVLTGSLHTSFSTVFDAAGGVHFKISTTPQGVSGTGAVTGAKYQASGSENTSSMLLSGGTITETFTNTFNLTAQGNVPNFKLKITQHLTINANGEVSAVVDHTETSCQ